MTFVSGEPVSEVNFLLTEEKGSGLSFLINSVEQLFRGCGILEVIGEIVRGCSELPQAPTCCCKVSVLVEECLKKVKCSHQCTWTRAGLK